MDQYINSSQNEFLWTLLANPANDAHLYAYNLQRLVNDFPQSGILQALLAHASDEKNLKHASAYFDARSLYKLINAPSAFTGVPDEKIIIQAGIGNNVPFPHTGNLAATQDEEVTNHESGIHLDDTAVNEALPEATIDEDADQQEGTQPGNIAVHNVVPEDIYPIEAAPELPPMPPAEDAIENGMTAANEVAPPVADEPAPVEEGSVENEIAATANTSTIEDANEARPFETPEQQPEKAAADEIFDEIISIEQITIETNTNPPAPIVEDRQMDGEDEKPAPAEELKGEAEKLIKGNIAATDFFMFDRAFGGPGKVKDVENRQAPLVKTGSAGEEKDSLRGDDYRDVSKYHDEKMPYTFMWWLDKTRKEYAGIYQPYIKQDTTGSLKKPKRIIDELQQQYFENIFHIASIEDLDKNSQQQTVPFDMKRKEHVIIERFIKEDPQIKPQSSDKLDNENKAKKSSEDRDELVTETLAAIYSDQMLYHKAIASYKKLMLKFPEKSRYFAAKIEQLEKKTN